MACRLPTEGGSACDPRPATNLAAAAGLALTPSINANKGAGGHERSGLRRPCSPTGKQEAGGGVGGGGWGEKLGRAGTDSVTVDEWPASLKEEGTLCAVKSAFGRRQLGHFRPP